MYVQADEVTEEGTASSSTASKRSTREYGKMGKSLKNSVTPDEMCEEYGADTLRLYEMSMGPLEVSRPWDTRAIVGSYRFLQRLWRNIVDEETGQIRVADVEPDEATLRALHEAIDGMRRDLDGLRFNTAIAKAIELNNHLTKLDAVPRSIADRVVLMVAPLVPHVAEELWARAGPRRLAGAPRLPGGRPGVRRRRDGHLRRADQGQGQGPPGGPAGDRRGRPARAGAGRRGRAGGAGRRRGADGRGAAAEAGEHRPCVTAVTDVPEVPAVPVVTAAEKAVE
ncbi:class I tRNA ligase family protein [Yinghuangia aomiensis]